MSIPQTWSIDCDVLLYAVGFVGQTTAVLDGEGQPFLNADGTPMRRDKPVLTLAPEQAQAQLIQMLQRILTQSGGTVGELYLTGVDNFREHWAVEGYPYKGNRAGQDKPLLYNDLREFLIRDLGAIVVDGFEADDQLAYNAHHYGWGIATVDKDLLQVPGWHFNWLKKDPKPFQVSEVEGLRSFYLQLMSGDATDNIPGLKKMTGQIATAKLKKPIAEATSEEVMWKHVKSVWLDAYRKNGMCLDDAETVVDEWLVRIGTLLWMDINMEGLGWVPPDRRSNEEEA